LVANRSRNYLHGKRLRCLLLNHDCHKFSLFLGHKRRIKDELIRSDKGSLHPAAIVKHRTTAEGRALETEATFPAAADIAFQAG
jgi:hypothetical protein